MVPGEKAAQQILAKYINLEDIVLLLFCSQDKYVAFVPSLLCLTQSQDKYPSTKATPNTLYLTASLQLLYSQALAQTGVLDRSCQES